MKRIKKWLFNRFLPAYCKDRLMRENEALAEKVREMRQENRELRAYIDGLERGVKAAKKIQIVNNRGE